jgi:hypothetical protein
MADPIFTEHLKPSKTPLEYDVFVAVRDGVADSIWSNSFMGLGSWDPDLKSWVSVERGDPNLAEWRKLTTYAIDWDNLDSFDENDKFIGYELFANGELTEEWLKENAKIAWDLSSNTSDLNEEE